MPDFWQFPTVSMGLGPMMAIYQARFLRYLEHRGMADTAGRKVWAFLGDGEMDEPESMGAITMPVREELDNLIFVINCNLQRLDGPVRGNGKIIQELEAAFRGAGWGVIKVVWGSRWDPLLARDDKGLLHRVMEECVDGEYQDFKAKTARTCARHFFGRYPELKEMVANMSDDEIWRLQRGGLDAIKVHAAYDRPSGRGASGRDPREDGQGLRHGRGRRGQDDGAPGQEADDRGPEDVPRPFQYPDLRRADRRGQVPYYRPPTTARRFSTCRSAAATRRLSAGAFAQRRAAEGAALDAFQTQLDGSGDREISTTMAFVRMLTMLVRDENIGKHIVPIVPDEARTFGMEGMFRQIGIYSSKGQTYKPQDAEQLMFYKEDVQGQILEEGINEGGAFCSWTAAATSYSHSGVRMIPFYIYYSMFGFQRIGDFIWAAGDMQARGFLIGGTAGRTTLAGEGLQHQDGTA